MILVTGGCGYLGSHCAVELINSGFDVVLLDNLRNSNITTIDKIQSLTNKKCELIKSDIRDYKNLEEVFKKYNFKAVFHFAGLKSIIESIKHSDEYMSCNVDGTRILINQMKKSSVTKIIFSSSATVYGNNHVSPLKEDMKLESINPYGSTKIIIEQLIKDYSKSNIKFKAISLRYFNPLGADLKAGLAEKPLGEPLNLMPALIQSIKNQRTFNIYGKNYDTPDGTCIRDYIHVYDIAQAFEKFISKNIKNKYEIFNLGSSRGYTVLEIIKKFEKLSGNLIKYKIIKAKKGDPSQIICNNNKLKKMLDWNNKYSNIDQIIKSSVNSFKI